MNEAPFLRQATTADAAALLDIYRPYVENTAVSFELVAPTVDEFAARINKALSRWEWLVAEANGECIAYAGIALPNEASIALHRSVGFAPIGVFKSAGRKFGAWHDIAWYGRVLRDEPLSEQRP